MELSTSRLKLRAWNKGDEKSLLMYANNRKVSINLRDRFPFPYTQKDALEWIELANQSSPLESFAIELDGHAIGGIGLILGTDIFRCSAEVGYWLGEPYWGKGLMTDALTLITEYAFKNFDLTRVWAGVFDWNPASAKVLEKAGYTFESRKKRSAIKDGKIVDELIYAVVR